MIRWIFALLDRLGWFLVGRERTKRKAAERATQTLLERDRIKDEVRNDTDSQLVDRLSDDKRV